MPKRSNIIAFPGHKAKPVPTEPPINDEQAFILERMNFTAQILQHYGKAFGDSFRGSQTLPPMSDLNVFHLADLMIEWRVKLRENRNTDAETYLDQRLIGKHISDDLRSVLLNSLREVQKGFQNAP